MTDRMRWAMMILVASRSSPRSACRMRASVAVSTAEVESSRMRIFGFASRARAMHSRCFCPPETLVPPCSMSWLYPSGKAETNPSACASRAARRRVSSSAFSSPQSRLSRTVPENSTFFCRTMPMPARRLCRFQSFTLTPSTSTSPSSASYSRGISETSVDLPEPVEPMMPTVEPAGMFRLMSSSTRSALSL